jgi:trans-aconitate methyltransferase
MSTPELPVADEWSSGERYEQYVGRWSRLVAPEFVDWLGLRGQLRWLDVGCGTGELSRAVLDRAAPSRLVGVDRSAGFVDYARRNVVSPVATFEVGDAAAVATVAEPFDAVVMGLVLNFLPDRQQVLTALAGAVVDGGVVAAYVWDYPAQMWLMRHFWDAAVELDPPAEQFRESARFPFCRPDRLEQLFADAGLSAVSSRAIVVPTVFEDFDDYWTPFLGGQGPAPSYVRSLDDPHRSALRDAVRARLPVGPDGSIRLTARAWAVSGRAVR